MLTIRLTRKGKKNQPFFRVVVIDKRRTASGGRAVEDLGYVDPLTKKKNFKKERVLYWISKGAQPSPSVHNLLVSEKIIDSKKIKISNISKKKQAEIKSEAEKAAAPVAASAPVVEAPKEEPKPTEVVTKTEEIKPAASAGSSVEPKEEKPAV